MTPKQIDDLARDLCRNNLTPEVAAFLAGLAGDVAELRDKVRKLEKAAKSKRRTSQRRERAK